MPSQGGWAGPVAIPTKVHRLAKWRASGRKKLLVLDVSDVIIAA